MEKIRILAITPYQELAALVADAAAAHPELELRTFTGYYENAAAFRSAFPQEEFDLIISRGGTSTLLESITQIPVVDIRLSTLDLLRVMLQAQQCGEDIALVSYPDVILHAEKLAEFMRLSIRCYAFDHPSQIDRALTQCAADGCQLVIGGAATREKAIAAGFQFMLLASGRESVEESLQQAGRLYRSMHLTQGKNRLLQRVLDQSSEASFVFDKDKTLLYANAAAWHLLGNDDRLEHALAGLTKELSDTTPVRLLKKIGGAFYKINGSTFLLDGAPCFQFHLLYSSPGYRPSSFAAIENPEETRNILHALPYTELLLKPFADAIRAASETSLPILIQGEAGSRKGILARAMHLYRAPEPSPFLCLSCQDITEKGWRALLNKSSSPLHALGYTVYFENVDLLPPELQSQLLSYIRVSNLAVRHRLIASSRADLSAAVAKNRFPGELYRRLAGFTVNMPPLQRRQNEIPAFINLMLPGFNASFSKSVVGLVPEAAEQMKQYAWPLNLVQLEVVLRRLVASAASYYISPEEVSQALTREQAAQTQPHGFDLSGTLEEIEARILRQVLQEENMNQTAAAKRLGIGRSTLWRKLSDGKK